MHDSIVAPYGLGVYTVHSKIRVYSTLAVLPIMHYCIIRCVGIIRCTVLYAYIRRLQESKHRMVQLCMTARFEVTCRLLLSNLSLEDPCCYAVMEFMQPKAGWQFKASND